MIRLATDIGTSGRGTLDGGNQMRIARPGHSETSRGISDCERNFTVLRSAVVRSFALLRSFAVVFSAHDEKPWRMASTRNGTSEVIAASVLRREGSDR